MCIILTHSSHMAIVVLAEFDNKRIEVSAPDSISHVLKVLAARQLKITDLESHRK